jgi:hypothetical protein
MTMTRPAPAEIIDFSLRLPCWLCGDLLHQVADLVADEFTWADKDGNRYGTDLDLRCLPGADPYARLKFLADAIMSRAPARSERTWLWHAYGCEYSALKVRVETGGTFHVHRVRASERPGLRSPEAPRHCGWPAWLRPSGWHCRECRIILGQET